MAPWKTSTAGSARSTSTSSNRRQACLKAALRGGFLISPPLPAQTRDIARHSSLPLRPTGFAMRSLGSVQFEIEKTNTDAMQYRAVWMEEAAFEIRKRIRVCPRRMPASFILETPHRKAHAKLNRQTKSRHRSWSRSFMFSSNASKSMRQSEDRATRDDMSRT